MRSNNSNESHSPNWVDGQKLEFEIFKHLTTLSIAVLLVVTALVEKVFETPRVKWFLIVACVLFLVSIYGSLASMVRVSRKLCDDSDYDKSDIALGVTAAGAFVLGLLVVFFFLAINVF